PPGGSSTHRKCEGLVHHVTALITMLAKGGPVMIPLLVCSVLSPSVIIERAGSWCRRPYVPRAAWALRPATHAKRDAARQRAGGEALTASAVGLGIAIATLVPYICCSARVERAAEAMERCGSRVEQALAEHEIP